MTRNLAALAWIAGSVVLAAGADYLCYLYPALAG
jgi:hypothetical protein